MIEMATRYTVDVEQILVDIDLPWSITQLGARAEYRFVRPGPRDGGESAAAADNELDEYMHLYMLNRGILMTPFHNMALMCPDTSVADIDRHSEVFADAVTDLVG
jgi:glutamate-1-semialdehyde 2,1-aminomutase